MTFPKIEDNIKELRGVIINKIIRNMDIPKHIHTFFPELIRDYLMQSGCYTKIFVSGVDAYNSFIVMAEKI